MVVPKDSSAGTEFLDAKVRRESFRLQNLLLKQIAPRTRREVPHGVDRDLTFNVLPGARRLPSTRRTMSNGRSERRIVRTVSLEVCLLDEASPNERTMTENVSAHGARVLMEQKLQPGQRVMVNVPREGVQSPARIVYCQRSSGGRFAGGLELSGRVELWARAY